jgi:hypothetical protein
MANKIIPVEEFLKKSSEFLIEHMAAQGVSEERLIDALLRSMEFEINDQEGEDLNNHKMVEDEYFGFLNIHPPYKHAYAYPSVWDGGMLNV